MRKAKMGDWWKNEGQRALSNNSVAYTEKPDMQQFMAEWSSIYESKSGERGIFSRYGANKTIPTRRKEYGPQEFIPNPCVEILLRPSQFCNLSTYIVRQGDTVNDLKRKARIAAIFGTIQATMTNFRYLRAVWKKNAEEEALLGVSMAGVMDHPVLNGRMRDFSVSGGYSEFKSLESVLEGLKEVAIETNLEWAKKLGINPSTAVTAIKPEGTVSQLTDSSSGIHGRFSQFYIRRVRNDKKDPMSDLLISQGVPYEEDRMNPSAWVFSFPMKAPENAVLASELSAIEQLDHWLTYKKAYTEHNPSVTIYVRESEWMEVGAWVYREFDNVVGISFLPYSDHVYEQAPYEAITEIEYEKFCNRFPKGIDFSKLPEFEKEDKTTATQTLACVAGVCEI